MSWAWIEQVAQTHDSRFAETENVNEHLPRPRETICHCTIPSNPLHVFLSLSLYWLEIMQANEIYQRQTLFSFGGNVYVLVRLFHSQSSTENDNHLAVAVIGLIKYFVCLSAWCEYRTKQTIFEHFVYVRLSRICRQSNRIERFSNARPFLMPCDTESKGSTARRESHISSDTRN